MIIYVFMVAAKHVFQEAIKVFDHFRFVYALLHKERTRFTVGCCLLFKNLPVVNLSYLLVQTVTS